MPRGRTPKQATPIQLNEHYQARFFTEKGFSSSAWDITWDEVLRMKQIRNKVMRLVTIEDRDTYLSILKEKIVALKDITLEERASALTYLDGLQEGTIEQGDNFESAFERHVWIRETCNVNDPLMWVSTPQGHDFWARIDIKMRGEGLVRDTEAILDLHTERISGERVRLHPTGLRIGCQYFDWPVLDLLLAERKRQMDKARKARKLTQVEETV